MKYDRIGQVWQIASDRSDDLLVKETIDWKTFTIISTAEKTYETISGIDRKYVTHKVVVSESGIVVVLNEDVGIPWEECLDTYRRIA
jgi:hypothetical protein